MNNYLKLLTGQQVGAEAELDEGRYVLGADDSCDLVLMDESVVGEHALLSVSTDSCTLEALQAGVTINGKPLAINIEQTITPGDVVGLGVVMMGIGDQDQAYQLPELDTVAPDEINATLADDESERTKDESTTAIDSTIATDSPNVIVEQPIKAPKKSSGAITRIVAMTLVVVMLCVGLGLPYLRNAIAQQDVIHAVLDHSTVKQEKLDGLLKSLNIQGLTVTETSQNVRLVGFVKSDQTLEKLSEALKSLSFPVVSKVYSEQSLLADVTAALNRIGGGKLKSEYLGDGNFSITGYYAGKLSKDEVITILKSDIPQVNNIGGDMRTLSDSVALLRTMARNQGLGGSLRIESYGARVKVGGVLDSDQLALWKDIVASFQHQVGSQPKIDNLVSTHDVLPEEVQAVATNPVPASQPIPSAPQTVKLKFPNIAIRGVVVSGEATNHYLALLKTGAVLSVGDVINDHFTVEKIEFNKVTLSNGHQSHIYYVGDNNGLRTL